MQATPPALMSIKAFCGWAGIGRTKVYEEIEAGRLSTVKVGRRSLVPMQQAQLWLEGLADG